MNNLEENPEEYKQLNINKMKKSTFCLLIMLLCVIIAELTSCSTNSDDNNNTTPTLIGKWAFGNTSECGRNMIEFKNTNVFIEHHYNSSCSLTPYYGDYILEGDLIEINTNEFIIVELTSTTLKLYSEANDELNEYDRVTNSSP